MEFSEALDHGDAHPIQGPKYGIFGFSIIEQNSGLLFSNRSQQNSLRDPAEKGFQYILEV